jgi:PAS domain S-box-containing protein
LNVSCNIVKLAGKRYFVGFHRDITEKKRAETSLQESERKYRLIFNSAPVGIFNIDNEGVIRNCNPKFLEINGSSYEKTIGFNLLKNLKDENMLNAIKDCLSGKTGRFKGKYLFALSGKTIITDAVFEPILSDTQQLMGGVCIIDDITEEKRAEFELQESHSQLQKLTKHIMSVREQERIRIARELHDELGQALTAINMEISYISKHLPELHQDLKSRAEAVSELAVGAIQSAKRIISELRPTLLDDLGLAEAIRWQAQEYQSHMGINLEVYFDLEDISLDGALSTAIFRIFQEATTNVIRHSHATRMSVRLKQTDAGIELKVKDNGIGITENRLLKNGSFGIMGMRERAEVFGGTIDISGIPGKGTTLVARLPV